MTTALACTPRSSPAPAKNVAVPVLSAETKAAWTNYAQRRCRRQAREEPEPECEPAKVQAALDAGCGDASTCIPALRRARRCSGEGNGPRMAEHPLDDEIERMVAEDCDGVVDALMASPNWSTPWWASGLPSKDVQACIERSKHPDVLRLTTVRGGSAGRDVLERDPERTVAWMRRFLAKVQSSPPGFLEALEFWKALDRLPVEKRMEILPEIREVASMPTINRWTSDGWRGGAIDRLAALGSADAVASLRALLGDAKRWTVQARAADALGSLGSVAAEARPDLQAIARDHWSRLVRAKAARAVRLIDGQTPPELDERAVMPPRDPGYPMVSLPVLGEERREGFRDFAARSVMLDGKRREFELDHGELPELPAALDSLDLEAQFPDHEGIGSWKAGLSLVLPVSGGWILGMNKGEFGGGAWFVDPDGKARLLSPGNVLGTVEFGGARFVLQGLGHMGYSDGALLRVVEEPGGVELELATELPWPPHAVAVVDERLLQATRWGVYIVSPDLSIEHRPYATQRKPPQPMPAGYPAALQSHLKRDRELLQRCLKPLSGLTDACNTWPDGTTVWVDVDAKGSVTQVLAAEDDPYGRPPTPEVASCVGQVASSWSFPALEDGWTSFGVTLAVE